MQYTLRNVPKLIDQALRRRARERGSSLNEAALDALRQGLGLAEQPVERRDLSGIVGTWKEDPELDRAIEAQDQIDEALWA